jgi:hypothetical protein
MKISIWGRILMSCFFIVMFCPVGVSSEPSSNLDNSIYRDLLKKFVHGGVVNYQGFKNEEARLDAYLDLLAQIDPDALSRNGQFAFYINAYNAWTIKFILTGYPGVKSIKDLGSFFKSPWKKKICRINGEVISLDEIEHTILRPRFKDPRVHFAINCASRGCPPLRAEPYEEKVLDTQLDDAARLFINDPDRTYLEENTLYVSSLFKWFSEDFGDVIDFISKHATGKLKKDLSAQSDNIRIKYLDYDWSLNGK